MRLRGPYARFIQLSVFGWGALALLSASLAFTSYRRALRSNLEARTGALTRLIETQTLRHAAERSYSSSRSFVLTGDDGFVQDMEDSRDEFRKASAKLERSGGDESTLSLLQRIDGLESRLHWLHRDAHRMRRGGKTPREVGAHMLATTKPVRDDLDGLLAELHAREEANVERAVEDGRSAMRHARMVSQATFASLGAAFILVFLLVRKLARAQLQISDTLRESNDGLERRVDERTKELRASNRELEAFSYAVAHDLRTPLRAITNYADVAVVRPVVGSDPALKDRIEKIGAAGRRMSQLIDGLLMLSRLTRRELALKELDLSALAAEVAGELALAYPERQVAVTIMPGLRDLADESLLRNLLLQLLGNSWKFTAKSSAPAVSFIRESVHDISTYCVRDNGVGFDSKYLHKILMPFERLHDPAEYPGSGIGLPTSERIVRRHGGTLWAEGAPGKGAAFYFTLHRRLPEKEREMTPENFRDI